MLELESELKQRELEKRIHRMQKFLIRCGTIVAGLPEFDSVAIAFRLMPNNDKGSYWSFSRTLVLVEGEKKKLMGVEAYFNLRDAGDEQKVIDEVIMEMAKALAPEGGDARIRASERLREALSGGSK